MHPFFIKFHVSYSGLGRKTTAVGTERKFRISSEISGDRRKRENNTQIKQWEKSIHPLRHP